MLHSESHQLMNPENHDHSVTVYIQGLRDGDEEASQKIWERFYERLIRLADRKLKESPRRVANEEDVVTVAFADFFKQLECAN